ncbi:DUF2341 domain-containing protein [bacterium]|nr:DUF2341 domain-containing protein [bacterium]
MFGTAGLFRVRVFVSCMVAVMLAFPALGQEVWKMYEAEDFQNYGGWGMTGDAAAYQDVMLKISPITGAEPPIGVAQTAISIPQADSYKVWVRCRDYATLPGVRLFRPVIDKIPLDEVGNHGVDGWRWQLAGELTLSAGEHMVEAVDTTNRHARFDAILFTNSATDPNTKDEEIMGAYRSEPVWIPVDGGGGYARPAPRFPLAAPAASLQNEHLRVTFHPYTDGEGQTWIVRQSAFNVEGQWIDAPGSATSETLFLLYSDITTYTAYSFNPVWETPGLAVQVTVGGQVYDFNSRGTINPFMTAPPEILIPTAATQESADTVRIDYQVAHGQNVIGYWTLLPGAHDVACSFSITAADTGYYSVGMLVQQSWEKEDVEFLQLPFLYQYQRFPKRPEMILSEMTPHPICLLQAPVTDTFSATFGPVCEPGEMDFRWSNARKCKYGFSLMNNNNKPQACIFTPVLGADPSWWQAGETHVVRFRLLHYPGRWTEALEYFSNEIMEVPDYRKPVHASLTEAVLNIKDLIMDSFYSGWTFEHKGFWDTETVNLSKQASPLTVLSAALLSRDETYWRERAMPTLEFTLSRKGSAMQIPTAENLNQYPLQAPGGYYSSAYWLGVHRLTDELNPWLEDFFLPGGEPNLNGSYNSSRPWIEKLEIYRWRPDPDLLAEIEQEALEFVETAVYGRQETPVTRSAFYNISFYPYWWDLVDVYEATGNSRFLEAAEECGFHTIAGLWSQPRHPDGLVTIHPGGEMIRHEFLKLREDYYYRLGYFPDYTANVQEKQVPGWQVSRIGYGLEQPTTYYRGEEYFSNIINAAWAPHLMRLYGASHRDIYRTYARNSVIGQFSNYPGYTRCDYTDIPQHVDYPYVGPDVTNIFYHHIPVHLAWGYDFIFAEAQTRSGGQVRFPFSKQKNYAWFSNNIYGVRPGEIYGHEGAIPWIERGLIDIDTVGVDWIAARSNNKFFVTLLSQSDLTTTAQVAIDTAKAGLAAGGAWSRYQGASPVPISQGVGVPPSITLAPKSVATYVFDAGEQRFYPRRPPLNTGHYEYALPAAYGQLHAFRVRVPFGKDYLYLFTTKGSLSSGTMQLTYGPDAQVVEKAYYPYELSVADWPFDQAATGTLRLADSTVSMDLTIPVNLPGLACEMAEADTDGTIRLRFNQAVDTATAGNASSYRVVPRYRADGSCVITGVTVQPDGKTVVLSVSPSLNRDASYEIKVEGVKDEDGWALSFQNLPVTMGTWSYEGRTRIGFDNTAQSEDLLDFPALVRVSAALRTATQVNEPKDLMFRDGEGQLLPFEVEKWPAIEDALLWVRVPRIAAGSDSDTIEMYYGGGGAALTPEQRTEGYYPYASVWPNGTSAVWHFNERTDASQHYNDASSPEPDSSQYPTLTPGAVGDAFRFDGNDAMGVTNADTLDAGDGPFTISAWINKDSLATMMIASKEYGYEPRQWAWGWGTDNIGFRSNDQYFYTATGSLTANTWRHVTFVRDGVTGHTYVDGAPSGGPHDMSGLPTLSNTRTFRIGRRDHISGSNHEFQGAIDELRFEKTARSADWVRASYLNQSGTTFTRLLSGMRILDAFVLDNRTVKVVFDTAPEQSTVSNAANYALTGDLSVTGVTWLPGEKAALLQVSPAVVASTTYELTISDLIDNLGLVVPQATVEVGQGALGWSRMAHVIFHNLEQSENLEEFPLLVRITEPDFEYDEFQAGGADLMFRDPDGTILPREIERWNTAGESCVWVRVPRIDGGSDTDYIEMYWGNANPPAPAAPESVWSTGFGGVWHLGDTFDATIQSNDGTANGATPGGGAIAGAMVFDGADDITIPDAGSLNFGSSPFTLSAWIRKDALSTMMVAAKQYGAVDNEWSYGWGEDKIAFRSASTYYYTAPGSLAANTWHHVVFVRVADRGYGYVDGEESGGEHNLSNMPPLTNGLELLIGRRNRPLGGNYLFRGIIDEVRLEHIGRSPDWVRASYLNQRPNSDFLRFEIVWTAGTPAREWRRYE